jgi:spore maturation protein CgeB
VKPGPRFSVEDVANGWIKGLKANGHEVIEFDLANRMQFFHEGFVALNKENKIEGDVTLHMVANNAAVMLQGACWEHSPDVVMIISGFYLPPSFYVHARRQHKTVLMLTESPYEDDWQIEAASFADMCIVNDDINLDQFNERTPSFYYGHGFDPDIHHPGVGNPDLLCEFSFVGTGYQERIEYLEQVDWSGLNAILGGNWPGVEKGSPLEPLLLHSKDSCLDNKISADLYRSSIMSANIYRKQATHSTVGNACGPREIEMAACGLFFFREPRPESDRLFPMLPVLPEPQRLHEEIRYWLEHSEERQQKIDLARENIQHRSFHLLAQQFENDLKTL